MVRLAAHANLLRQRAETAVKAVVVTGASSGIGRAVAARLAEEGFHVFAAVRRTEDAVAVEAVHPAITGLRFDVTDESAIAAAAEQVEAKIGAAGLAGLVNNAGIAVAGPLELVPLADLRSQLEVNVVGQVAVTQAFLPALARARGRIVHMGSPSGRLALPMLGPYAASKFALVAVNDTLRAELAGAGIRVVIVEPSGVSSSIWERSIRAAQERFASAPADRLARYGDLTEKALERAARSADTGRSVEPVVQAVLHALTAGRPRTRYVVGGRSWLGSLVGAFLPARLRDRILARLTR